MAETSRRRKSEGGARGARWGPPRGLGIWSRGGPHLGLRGLFRRFLLLPDLLVTENILVKIPRLFDFGKGSQSNKYKNRHILPDRLDYQQ